jgi:hypothetical protein
MSTVKVTLPNNAEANRMARAAIILIEDELGLLENGEESDDDLIAILELVIERAEQLWRSNEVTKLPPLYAVFHSVRRRLFLHEMVAADEVDGDWFTNHPGREVRVRKPLPHETLLLPDCDQKCYRASTIVTRGAPGEPPEYVIALTRQGCEINMQDDEALLQALQCSTSTVWM